MIDLGNYLPGTPVYTNFTTYGALGAPAAASGVAAKVYQQLEVGGTAVTVAVIPKTIPGFYEIVVATTDAYFAEGNEYFIVLTAGTVDGIALAGSVIARFSLDNRHVKPTPLQSGVVASATASTVTLDAGPAADGILVGHRMDITTAPGDKQSRLITGYTASTKACTIAPDWTTNPSGASNYEVHWGDREENLYTADVRLDRDNTNSRDEYTCLWFKNGELATGITSPTIQVVKRADGTDLIPSTAMTAFGVSGFKFDEGTSRITPGEAVEVIVTATIDGAARTFARPLGRDTA